MRDKSVVFHILRQNEKMKKCSLVTRDGGSLFQRNSQLQDQVCCQAPHLRGACPALATEGGAKLPKEERNLSKEGLEDEEERVSHAPEGQPF